MTDLSVLIPIVKNIAPGLAKLLPAPFGSLVSIGLEKLFGSSPGDANDLLSKIQADPDAAFKLKQFEAAHNDLIVKLNSSDYQAFLNDTQNARLREMQQEQITGKRDYVLDYLSIFIVMGFFLLTLVVSMTTLDKSDHDILYMLVGQGAAGFLAVVGYHFGNSRNQSIK